MYLFFQYIPMQVLIMLNKTLSTLSKYCIVPLALNEHILSIREKETSYNFKWKIISGSQKGTPGHYCTS
uniref:Uncharacterized protein n=1 Tax=Anguilla anguilla TaxID=7936 RepID=A0A0E9WGE1_ANGAN